MKSCSLALSCLLILCLAAPAQGRYKEFGQFAVDLPPGWDGDEQTGFISDNPEEYMLILGRKDADMDKFTAQISIYLLPNKPGKNAEQSAQILAESQGEATEPAQRGNFWQFEGEPRGNVLKGRALTMVNANKERLLIIIAQDPERGEAAEIVASLRGSTPKARELLGR